MISSAPYFTSKLFASLIPLLLFTFHLLPTYSLPGSQGFVETHDGEKLYYETIGDGEPIVILHGGPGWYFKSDYNGLKGLSNQYKLIFFDQRGSGKSKADITSETITLDNFLQDISSVINHFGYEKVNLLGVSFGGVLGTKYAIENPKKVNSLILLSPGGLDHSFRESINESINKRLNHEDLIDYQAIPDNPEWKDDPARIASEQYKVIFRAYFYDKVVLDTFQIDIDSYTAQSQKKVSKYLLENMGDFNYYNDLDIIKDIRVLILRGDYDPIPDSFILKYKVHHPNLDYVEFNNVGHFPHYEARRKTLQEITNFLED